MRNVKIVTCNFILSLWLRNTFLLISLFISSFLETNVPLLVLIRAAQNGNEKEVEEYAVVFTEHSDKLVEVANLVCSMSNNEDGVKMVRYAAAQIDSLCPEVINAARILAARPRSKVAQENMDAFKQSWENQVRILTEAVDDITTIDDFLAVSENHILEDVNKCVLALQEGNDFKFKNLFAHIKFCNVFFKVMLILWIVQQVELEEDLTGSVMS